MQPKPRNIVGEKESPEEEGGASEDVEEKKNSKENVLEKPTSAAAAPVPATSSPTMKDSRSRPDRTVEEGNTSGWPMLPDSFYQNLDSPFLGKDDLIEKSLKPESSDYDRQRLQDASKMTQMPVPSNLHEPIIKSYTLDPIANNVLGRAGEEGLEDLRRRRRLLLARLQKLKKEKMKAKEKKGTLRGRDGEEEEMAILSLEAKEGGASLHKRIMDYTSRDFSARTDPTTAIVNAASRHLD